MVARRKRSISVPPELDAAVEEAAAQAGTTYSGWLAAVARKELTIRAGLDAVSEYEKEHGAFTPEEVAEATAWARSVAERSKPAGKPSRRSA